MTTIIAIETATSSCSVALRIDGQIELRSELGNNIHSQVLLSMVEGLLSEAKIGPQSLDAVAVGQGPGSFTGLRIGVGVGQGLAYGANCPMIGISSLDALALQAQGEGVVVAAIDARMGEVYWCEYHKIASQIRRVGEVLVSSPAQVSSSATIGSDVILVGNAWLAYPDQFSSLNIGLSLVQEAVVYPSAGQLLSLAEDKYSQQDWVCAAAFRPLYVRDDVAKKSTKKLPGRRVGVD